MAQLPTYTLADVAAHNTEQSTWIVVDGRVIDVTRFLNEHPGGANVLLEQAGKDATSDFTDIGHSDSAKSLLLQHQIGVLAGYDPASSKARSPPVAGGATPGGPSDFANEAAAREAFRLYDVDGSGAIDASELQSLAYSLGELLTEEDTHRMIAEIDKDGDGLIQFNEWFSWWQQPRVKRTTDAQPDSKLETLRIQLLAKYTLNKVADTVDELRRSAAQVPVTAPPANPNEIVELKFKLGVGKIETPKTTVHLYSTVHEDNPPARVVLEFNLRSTHYTHAEIEELKAAADTFLKTAYGFAIAAAANKAQAKGQPRAPPPVMPPNPTSVEVENGLLRLSVLIPMTAKFQNTQATVGLIPGGVNFDFRLRTNADFQTSSVYSEFDGEIKLSLTLGSLPVLRGLAAIAGKNAENAIAVLGLLEALHHFTIDVGFNDLSNWVANLKVPIPLIPPTQLVAIARAKIGALLTPANPLYGIIAPFLKVAQKDNLVTGLASVRLGFGPRTLVVDLTGFDIMALVPQLP